MPLINNRCTTGTRRIREKTLILCIPWPQNGCVFHGFLAQPLTHQSTLNYERPYQINEWLLLTATGNVTYIYRYIYIYEVPCDISVWELCEMMAPKKLLSWLVTNPALWRIWLCVVFIFMGFIIQLTGGLHLLYPPSPFLPHSSQATQVVVSPLVSPVLGWCKERHCDFAFGANANLAIGWYVS